MKNLKADRFNIIEVINLVWWIYMAVMNFHQRIFAINDLSWNLWVFIQMINFQLNIWTDPVSSKRWIWWDEFSLQIWIFIKIMNFHISNYVFIIVINFHPVINTHHNGVFQLQWQIFITFMNFHHNHEVHFIDEFSL